MKKIIIIFSILFISIGINAQNTISTIFIAMPDDLLIGISADQRAELVAEADSTEVIVESAIKEDIERTALTDDYIALKTSDAGTLEIKLLPLVNDTDIVGVITTVCGPACDSRIDFYTTTWQPLAQNDLFPVKDKSWFLKDNSEEDISTKENAVSVLDMTPIKLSFEADTKNVKAEYDVENYLSSEDYALLEPFLVKEPIVLKWDKLSFKR